MQCGPERDAGGHEIGDVPVGEGGLATQVPENRVIGVGRAGGEHLVVGFGVVAARNRARTPR